MNQRLPWACFHQLTSINKMHGVLSPGSPVPGPASVAEHWTEARKWKSAQHSSSGGGGIRAGTVNTLPCLSIMVCPSKKSLIQLAVRIRT